MDSFDYETNINSNDPLFIDEIVDNQKSFRVKTIENVSYIYVIEITAVSGDSRGLIEFSSQQY